MNRLQRLRLHIGGELIKRGPRCSVKQENEIRDYLSKLTETEEAEIKESLQEGEQTKADYIARIPKLEPRRTMLFSSGSRRCNFLTAWWYRRMILNHYRWGIECGFTSYIVDSYSPLGLLALETLGKLKKEGEDLTLYCVHGCRFAQRRSYRLIPETGLEILLLEHGVSDYTFRHLSPQAVWIGIFDRAGVICTEHGRAISPKWISQDLLDSWAGR